MALWREGLLAKAVLSGSTKGYRHHPQLERFRRCGNPLEMIDAYLYHVFLEASARGYRFDETKIEKRAMNLAQPIRRGQLTYEWAHLLSKLWTRDRKRWLRERQKAPKCHPIFRVVSGAVEPWERGPLRR